MATENESTPGRRHIGAGLWKLPCGCIENPKGVHRGDCPDFEMVETDGKRRWQRRPTEPLDHSATTYSDAESGRSGLRCTCGIDSRAVFLREDDAASAASSHEALCNRRPIAASDLPEGSVVATEDRAWIKKLRPRSAVAPVWWYSTGSGHVDDAGIDAELARGAQVLRVGAGQEG